MSEPYAFLIQGPRRQAKLRLQGSFFVVGRAEPFPVFQDDPTISRDHLVVVAAPEGVRVKDLGAKNGVAVNGRRLERYDEAPLSPGDVLVVGNTRLQLLDEQSTEGAAVTVDPEGRAEEPRPEDGAPASAPDPTPEELAALERTQAFEEEAPERDALERTQGIEEEAGELDAAAEETAELEAPEGGASPDGDAPAELASEGDDPTPSAEEEATASAAPAAGGEEEAGASAAAAADEDEQVAPGAASDAETAAESEPDNGEPEGSAGEEPERSDPPPLLE